MEKLNKPSQNINFSETEKRVLVVASVPSRKDLQIFPLNVIKHRIHLNLPFYMATKPWNFLFLYVSVIFEVKVVAERSTIQTAAILICLTGKRGDNLPLQWGGEGGLKER